MNLVPIDVQQGSKEWMKIRTAKFTGSDMHRLMSLPPTTKLRQKGALSVGAETYVLEKVEEMITGEPAKSFGGTKATDWGKKYEPEAAYFYSLMTGNELKSCGFYPITRDSGCSPDGIIIDPYDFAGVAEIKCHPKMTEHMKYAMIPSLKTFRSEPFWFTCDLKDFKKLHKDYFYQTQAEMIAAKVQWCDFISYHPHMPIGKEMIVIRMCRDDNTGKWIKDRIKRATDMRDSIYLDMVLSDS